MKIFHFPPTCGTWVSETCRAYWLVLKGVSASKLSISGRLVSSPGWVVINFLEVMWWVSGHPRHPQNVPSNAPFKRTWSMPSTPLRTYIKCVPLTLLTHSHTPLKCVLCRCPYNTPPQTRAINALKHMQLMSSTPSRTRPKHMQSNWCCQCPCAPLKRVRRRRQPHMHPLNTLTCSCIFWGE